MVKIGVRDLKARIRDELEFDFQENWSYLSTANGRQPVVAPVCVRGKVTNTGRTLLVDAEAITALQLICDRCLTAFKYPLKVYLQEEYAANKGLNQKGSGDEWQAEELRPLEGDTIDLRPAVEEALTLALPMKVLCHEECRGLCSHCGQNFNEGQCRCANETVDPRLAVLGKLLSPREGEN